MRGESTPPAGSRAWWSGHLLLAVRVSLAAYLLTFALGPTWQSGTSLAAGLAVAGLYLVDFSGSNLRRCRPAWLVAALLAWFAVKTFASLAPELSWSLTANNARRGFALFFAALEALRGPRDIRRFCWVLTLASAIMGLDGMWQAATGRDLIAGDPLWPQRGLDRLTASLGTPRVGNYLALVWPACLALPALLRDRTSRGRIWLCTALLTLPGLFTLAGSLTRSAWLGAAAAVGAYLLARRHGSGRRTWLIALVVSVALVGVVTVSLLAGRGLAGDERWCIWAQSWRIAIQQPWTGVGVGATSSAPEILHLTPPPPCPPDARLPHPHNMYLQLLVETGVIGLLLGLAALVGGWLWAGRRVWSLREQTPDASQAAAAALWGCWAAWLASGVTGHNLFKDWWLGTALTVVGLGLSAALSLGRTARR